MLGNSMGAAAIFAYVSLYGTQKVVKILDHQHIILIKLPATSP
ncbi:hypothetical protein [Loigolactobacillus coryniformis]|nr:hypothetical protein [Loigolactobacillus coryniformis]